MLNLKISCGLLLGVWGINASATTLPDPEKIHFSAPVYESSESIKLDGYLYRPEGTGPHPAIIDLHGCNGISSRRTDPWIRYYLEWGFVVLQVDSFRPRQHSNICGALFAIPTWQRAEDAHAAKRYLQKKTWIKHDQIFLTGYSHGATTTLLTLDDDINADNPFAGAIAIGPWCLDTLRNSHTDLLILIGEDDQWTPAHRCEVMISTQPERVQLVIYDNAHHGFDSPGLNSIYLGYQLMYDEQATQDAVRQTRKFLQQRSGF